jgi:hypothetical protein
MNAKKNKKMDDKSKRASPKLPRKSPYPGPHVLKARLWVAFALA